MTDPKQPVLVQTFFVVEVQDGCEELHGGACKVVELAAESAIALLRTSFAGKKNAPKVVLHRPGTFDLGKVGS